MDVAIKAIAESRRREILHLLAVKPGLELSAGDIAANFEVTRPAISQHLGVLREAGLVNIRPEGTRRMYSLNHAQFIKLKDYLAIFWDTGLQRLKYAAESVERTKKK